MATTGRLGDIAALNDQLGPLGGRQRGQPIQADQWNALVDVLRGILEIDRAQETGVAQSLADSFARADHEHLGQVSLAWLDSDLQARLGDGAGSVSIRAALADVTARLADTARQVVALTSAVERIQQQADETAVDELTRSSTLRSFEGRFTGLEDLRGLVTGLSASVAGLQPAVQTVLDLRSQLTTAAGQPIDVRGLAAQLDSLTSTVTDATTGVDGRSLRLRDIEIQLREVQDVAGVGGGGGLEGRLATLSAELQGKIDNRQDERFTAQQQSLDERLTALTAALDERFARAADEITQKVVDQAGDRVVEVAVEKVRPQLIDLVAAGVSGQIADTRAQLKEFQTVLRDQDVRLKKLER
jgi:hypothetical protein